MALTQTEINLMIYIIDNLEIYTTDDNHVEMKQDMKPIWPNWDTDVKDLKSKLYQLRAPTP